MQKKKKKQTNKAIFSIFLTGLYLHQIQKLVVRRVTSL